MAKPSGQKFIARNRAPRVQIEYELEVYGTEKKVELPFVMGVLADLGGDSRESLQNVDNRKFVDFDSENLDERMRAIRPSVEISVPNRLTGEGSLALNLTFESLEEFSPARLAARVEPLAKLLEARTQLTNLVTYMDGKAGAEELVAKVLNDPALLNALAGAPKPASSSDNGHGQEQ
jgi:type VI secretion system protein ImpB